MPRRFQFSWVGSVFGAIFGAAIGVAICWVLGADQAYWFKTSLALAFVFGALA